MNVNINITTNQYDEHAKIDTINMSATGTMYEKNNDIYVVYKEKEDDKETTNTIKISKDEINIKKFGDINSSMHFKKNETDFVKYRTSQGLFIIENQTTFLSIDKSDLSKIKIVIDYKIKIMDFFNGRNKIEILISKDI